MTVLTPEDKETVRKIADAVEHLSAQERVDVLLSGAAMFALEMRMSAKDFIGSAIEGYFECCAISASLTTGSDKEQ